MSKQRNTKRATSSRRTAQAGQLEQTAALLGELVDACVQLQPRLVANERIKRSFACYVFGLLLAHGKHHGLPPAAVMGTLHMLLITKFGFNAHTAEQLTHAFINATQPGSDTALHTMIYRGIAGHPRWVAAGAAAVLADVDDCAAAIDARSKL